MTLERVGSAAEQEMTTFERGGAVAVATIDRAVDMLQRDARLTGDEVTRPHALLAVVWRTVAAPSGRAQERMCVVLAPAIVWDRERELFAPFTGRFADGEALLVLLGRPLDRTLNEAVSRGLASL
ncbi:MAG TPA: hypothetical protein VIY73_10240, partial [Polyangiaceae bacterium]